MASSQIANTLADEIQLSSPERARSYVRLQDRARRISDLDSPRRRRARNDENAPEGIPFVLAPHRIHRARVAPSNVRSDCISDTRAGTNFQTVQANNSLDPFDESYGAKDLEFAREGVSPDMSSHVGGTFSDSIEGNLSALIRGTLSDSNGQRLEEQRRRQGHRRADREAGGALCTSFVVGPSSSPAVSARSLAQRVRRERERQAPEHLPSPTQTAPLPGPNPRSVGQRRRRERERQERHQREHRSDQGHAERGPQGTHEDHRGPIGYPTQQERDQDEGQEQIVPLATPPLTVGHPKPVDNRSLAQRRRRERERQEREQSHRDHEREAPPPVVNREEMTTLIGMFCVISLAIQAIYSHCVCIADRALNLPPARRPYREPTGRHDLGYMDQPCLHCGALHWIDERLTASSVASPAFSSCCGNGQVRLEPLQDPPDALRQLFLSDTPESREFLENIRQYNAAFAFTSLGVKQDLAINTGFGPYIFRIHGELCHRAGSLLPTPGQTPSYAQLYIHDPRAALEHRTRRNSNLRADTMQIIQDVLTASHHYAHVYKHAHEILQEHVDVPDVAIRLRCAPNQDRRRYNMPTVDEIAVVVPGDGSQPMESRDIILRLRSPDCPLQRISDGHVAYTSLHYVILFPYGEDGWHWDLEMHQPERGTPRRVSQVRHCAYRMFTRATEFNIILRGGRLFQQYMVDMWASADQNRLNYLRSNQRRIRASLYSGLDDAVAAADRDLDLHELGRRFILPSSYTGGPRYMQQCLQDSLALARYFRKIDLFITVTCNPQWPEIQRELFDGQQASDRPDLVARVFALKKKAILRAIYEDGVFGRAAAYVYVIEFQKRGLPHMHLLVFLEHPYKLLTPEDIDTAICAQWPDPEKEPLLFETVSKCMVHGPCGPLNPNAPCMEGGRCTKNFPKSFQELTVMDTDGYPKYKRPDDGRRYEVRGHMVGNEWIVPYNPKLSAEFNCHINVECAVSFASVKYINKYMHKGGDRTTLEVDERDEIKRYIDSRYFSSPEAVWRVLRNDIHQQEPNIVRLQVHLPGQHLVTYDPDEDIQTVMERAAVERTTLTGFFEANADLGPLGLEARKWTYQEFPNHFVWKTNQKHWAIRQRGFAIGRMYFVPPTAGEKFYMRTLLTVTKGPHSFEDLRTVDGVTHATFREACLARGLLEDDGEWRQCLQEAADLQSGTRLRHLFATLLLFCNPTQPDILWYTFRHHICDDLRHRLTTSMGRQNPTDDVVYDFGLHLLNKILRQSGRSLAEFPPMPTPQEDWDAQAENHQIAQQLDFDREAERRSLQERLPLFNEEQANAYHRIIQSVEQQTGQLFFLNGPGGTGKTFVYNTICHRVRSEGWIVLCVASSGIAALLLRSGRTAHSTFKIPIDGLTDDSHCSIPKEGMLAGMLRLTRLIIWDEITMQHRHAPEAVDRTLRDIRNNESPFGGITVVFGGDFQQILPVVVKGSREEIVGASLQRSYLWQQVEILKLHRNMRLEQNPSAREFSQWLLDVGHGRGLDGDGLHLHESMRCDNLQSLIDFIYPGLGSRNPPPAEYFLNRMILSARNSDVDDINNDILEQMAGVPKVFMSADSVVSEAGADGELRDTLPIEFLRSISGAGLPPGELKLKPGCPLILLRNLAPGQGLCNGTRMVVVRMTNKILEVRLIGGDHDGELAFIPRITLTPSGNLTDFAFVLKRRQFPVRLAFVMTINRAQGQSAKFVGLDLRVPVFSHGQLYVALSRATSGDRIKALLPGDSDGLTTPNIVYPEVLLD